MKNEKQLIELAFLLPWLVLNTALLILLAIPTVLSFYTHQWVVFAIFLSVNIGQIGLMYYGYKLSKEEF